MFLREVVAHNENVPDIVWEDKIYSLKLRIDHLNKILIFYQSKDLKPKYGEAKKRETIYKFVFLNLKWSSNILIKEIGSIKNIDVIVAKPNRIIVEPLKKS